MRLVMDREQNSDLPVASRFMFRIGLLVNGLGFKGDGSIILMMRKWSGVLS